VIYAINEHMRALLHRFASQIGPDVEEVLTVALHVALVLLLGWLAWKLCSRGMRLARERMVRNSAGPDAVNRIETMTQVLRYAAAAVILVVAGMLALDQLGFAIAPLLATAGVAGVAVGFGLQSLMKDYFAGVVLLIEDQIRKGDVIEAAGKAGLVEQMTLRHVRVRDYDGNVHFIPNGTITTVTNLSREYAYAVIDAGIAYRADIDRAFGVMRQVAADMRANDGYSWRIREDLEIAGVERWENSSVVLRARLKVVPLEQWNVKREFLKRLKYAFDAGGIEIPYPHLTVYSGNAPVRAPEPFTGAERGGRR
jgi:moderate conductance mechanosensitive channel